MLIRMILHPQLLLQKALWLLALLFFGFALAACSAPAEQLVEPGVVVADSPTTLPVPVEAAPTAEAAVTLTPIPAMLPTTVQNSSRLRPTPTRDDLGLPAILSPDGQWEAILQSRFPEKGADETQYRELLIVRQIDGPQEWVVLDQMSSMGLGFTEPHLVGWGETVLYFNQQSHSDGCGVFAYETELKRVDLATGVVQLYPGTAGSGTAVASDGSAVAVMQQLDGNWQLLLQPLDMGSATSWPIDLEDGQISQAGGMVWSPDDGRLVLTAVIDMCGEDWQHLHLLVDLNDGSQQLLFNDQLLQLRAVRWEEETIFYQSVQGDEWAYDLASGELKISGR